MCTFEGSQEYFAYKKTTLSLSCILIILDDLPQLKSNDHDTHVPLQFSVKIGQPVFPSSDVYCQRNSTPFFKGWMNEDKHPHKFPLSLVFPSSYFHLLLCGIHHSQKHWQRAQKSRKTGITWLQKLKTHLYFDPAIGNYLTEQHSS